MDKQRDLSGRQHWQVECTHPAWRPKSNMLQQIAGASDVFAQLLTLLLAIKIGSGALTVT